jgi:hypothetical protein
MKPRLSFLRALVGVGLLSGATGCDGGGTGNPPPSSVDFNGVTYHTLGQAVLSVQGGVLVVDNVGTTGFDGVRVESPNGALDSLGVEIQPISLASGALWGLGVYGDVSAQRELLAGAWAEDIGGGRNAIQVEFLTGVGLDQVLFEYYLDGLLVVRSPPVPAADGFSSTVATAGTTNVGPTSVHAVREGGIVVIGTDYRTDGLQGGGAPGVGCLAALIEVQFQPDPVCADFVRAVPLSVIGTVLPPVSSSEVGGRGIGRFVVTDGTVL